MLEILPFDLEIIMKAIIIAAAASALALGASTASAAPVKQSRERSPQVTAHEQTTTKRDSGNDFWSQKPSYKPHWRNHYTN